VFRMEIPMHIPPPTAAIARPPGPDADLRRAAEALETAFLAEFLAAAGTARPPEGQDGGTGEAQFASFMTEAQARAMVTAGGLGLTGAIMAALARQGAGDPA
jgi:peptidoglycan hydrolase FlgJ